MQIHGKPVVKSVYTQNNAAIGHITFDGKWYQYHILTDSPTVRSPLCNTQDYAEVMCRYELVQQGFVQVDTMELSGK